MMAAGNIFQKASESMINSFIDMLVSAMNVLSGTKTDMLDPENLEGFVDASQNVIKGFALSVMGVLFCVELIQNVLMKGENFQYTDVIACLIKVVICKALIDYTDVILEALYFKGTEMIEALSGKTLNPKDLKETLTQAYSDGYADDGKIKTMISNIGLFATRLIALVVIQISGVIIMVMATVRRIELTFLSAISPIAFCFAPYKDTSNITVRFVTNYFSVVLQGLMMVASFTLYNTLIAGYISPGDEVDVSGDVMSKVMTAEDGWILLMYTIILIMCLAFSGKWAKTALGIS